VNVDAAQRLPSDRQLLSLREDVLIESDGDSDGPVVVLTPWGEVALDQPGPVVRESLRRMTLGPVSLRNVLTDGRVPTRFDEPEIDTECGRLEEAMDLLQASVVYSLGVQENGGLLLSAIPIARHARFVRPKVGLSQPIRLSRFTALRGAPDGGLQLESPLSLYRVLLHRAPATLLSASLGTTTTVADLATCLGIDPGLAMDLVEHLVATAMVITGTWTGSGRVARYGEDDDPGLIPWSHHDLQFHARTRVGRQEGPLGPVFPYADQLAPAPVVKPAPIGPRYPLHRPNLDTLAAQDPTLTAVIEGRKSFHRFAEQPVTASQLGELLYRAARVRSLRPGPGEPVPGNMSSDRPYPSAFGLHELELYLTVDRCTGLPCGIYHYDPQAHVLTLVNAVEQDRAELLDSAMVTAGMTRRPPVLLSMTARIARLAWVYGGLAYATTLKHVGVLQQTLYLSATAMGLAPCALAVGDGEMASRAFGLDWPAECSVGEFLIGLPAQRSDNGSETQDSGMRQ
jgi:SagB-type dehydrogenase family enzyme